MSWLLIIILIITLLSVLAGIRKGLIRTIVSTFFLGFVMILSVWLTPYAENALKDYTSVESFVNAKCDAFIENALTSAQGTGEEAANPEAGSELENISGEENIDISELASQIGGTESLEQLTKSLGLPAYWAERLIQGSTEESFQGALQESVASYAKAYLAGAVMKILSFLLAFVISIIFIWIVLRAVDIVTALPFISLANRFGGAVVGLARSVLWVWIFFAVLAIFGETQWGAVCMREIEQDQILGFLYSNNLLLDIILKML